MRADKSLLLSGAFEKDFAECHDYFMASQSHVCLCVGGHGSLVLVVGMSRPFLVDFSGWSFASRAFHCIRNKRVTVTNFGVTRDLLYYIIKHKYCKLKKPVERS